MNRFIIHDGLPYLFADGKTYAVRWDDEGFAVGAEVSLASASEETFSELSVKAKCEVLDSINGKSNPSEKPLSEMTLAELKAYAAKHDIKLGSARTKEAVIDAIAEALI